eukprot:3936512-Alexandrium_andersonii.AAC.1
MIAPCLRPRSAPKDKPRQHAEGPGQLVPAPTQDASRQSIRSCCTVAPQRCKLLASVPSAQHEEYVILCNGLCAD